MKTICLILAVVALSSGQKAYKAGGQKHGGSHYSGEGQSYDAPSPKQHNHHSGAYQPQQYGGHGASATAAKPSYPLLISDNRQLNQDGTINFNYAADNGLQQGETVDPDGTRRGFYSYIGADGKPLTVKYTAGKNGFVAEGDHLPKQPNNPVVAQTKEEGVSKHGGSYQGGPSSGNYYGGAPAHYSAAVPSGHGHGHGHGGHGQGPSAYNGGNNHYSGAGRNHYNPPSPYHDANAARSAFGGFPGAAGHGGQSHGHGQYQSAPQTQYTQALPSHGHHGQGSGSMHSAFNPYTPSGPAGPYSGQFDLGNGGHYSINFEPGTAQPGTYGGGNPGHGGQQQQY